MSAPLRYGPAGTTGAELMSGVHEAHDTEVSPTNVTPIGSSSMMVTSYPTTPPGTVAFSV